MYDRGYVYANGVQYVGTDVRKDDVQQYLYSDYDSEEPLLKKLIEHLNKTYPGATLKDRFDLKFFDNLQLHRDGYVTFEFEGVIEFDKTK